MSVITESGRGLCEAEQWKSLFRLLVCHFSFRMMADKELELKKIELNYLAVKDDVANKLVAARNCGMDVSISSDVDNTLTKSGGDNFEVVLQDGVRESMSTLSRNGVKINIATARSHEEVEDKFYGVTNLTIISNDGCMVRSPGYMKQVAHQNYDEIYDEACKVFAGREAVRPKKMGLYFGIFVDKPEEFAPVGDFMDEQAYLLRCSVGAHPIGFTLQPLSTPGKEKAVEDTLKRHNLLSSFRIVMGDGSNDKGMLRRAKSLGFVAIWVATSFIEVPEWATHVLVGTEQVAGLLAELAVTI